MEKKKLYFFYSLLMEEKIWLKIILNCQIIVSDACEVGLKCQRKLI